MRLQNRILILFSLLFTVGFLFLTFFSANAIERTNRNMVDAFSTQSLNSNPRRWASGWDSA